jgi:hypothetical protein
MAKGQNEALYRVAKFPIYPSGEQVNALRKISANLWKVWNDALEERTHAFTTHLAPLYTQFKSFVESQDAQGVRSLRREISRAYGEHIPTLFDQIGDLTEKRRDRGFSSTPRNWQEETLDTLDGAYKSFLALRKKGDYDARPPRVRDEWEMSEIPGRSGFSIRDGCIELSRKSLPEGVDLRFPIPEYQQGELARAERIKKFTLFRTPRDMREEGRWWISVAYELPPPMVQPFVPEEAAFVALGASSVGVISSRGEVVIDLWRPDKHWKPKIDAMSEQMKRCTKGSRQWKKLNESRKKMFRLMSAQQKLNHREVVACLIREHGVHFVVTEYVVRSKKGKLADAEKTERSGSLGLNWAAQNTGSLAALVAQLMLKAQEHGGNVLRLQFTPPETDLGSRERKIPFAKLLREQFLRTV